MILLKAHTTPMQVSPVIYKPTVEFLLYFVDFVMIFILFILMSLALLSLTCYAFVIF